MMDIKSVQKCWPMFRDLEPEFVQTVRKFAILKCFNMEERKPLSLVMITEDNNVYGYCRGHLTGMTCVFCAKSPCGAQYCLDSTPGFSITRCRHLEDCRQNGGKKCPQKCKHSTNCEFSNSKHTEIVHLSGKKIHSIEGGLGYFVASTDLGIVHLWKRQSGTKEISQNWTQTLVNIGNEKIESIGNGYRHWVALTGSGTVYVWRHKKSNNDFTHPIKVTQLSSIMAIACGCDFSLALTDSGQVYGWGENGYGQLGLGASDDKLDRAQSVPVQMRCSEQKIVAIACGRDHSLVLTSNGQVLASGANHSGQCALPSYLYKVSYPSQINLGDQDVRFVAISAVFQLSVAQSDTGYCYVWGRLKKEDLPQRIPLKINLNSMGHAFGRFSTTSVPLLIEISHSPSMVDCTLVDRLSDSPNPKSDLRFVNENHTVYAHSWVIKESSEYYRNMFKDQELSGSVIVVYNQNHPYRVFIHYLKFLYRGRFEPMSTYDDSLELLRLSIVNLDSKLKRHSYRHLASNISLENCIPLYQFSSKYSDCLVNFKLFLCRFIVGNITKLGLELMPKEQVDVPLLENILRDSYTINLNNYKLNRFVLSTKTRLGCYNPSSTEPGIRIIMK